jgi:phage shock protein PspC (stress-responsive transcriptional regulator)
MNKTVTVNIGGIVFHIDENAYEMFRKYLDSIRSHFTSSEGRDEIMQDIESRVAEMFQERIKDSKQVITIEDVEEVTTIMGKPEQFTDEESRSSETTVPAQPGLKRRLFRDPDDKLLGGVCSGVSAYFDLDPVWIRLAFAIAFFAWGTGFILYILLWIIIPEAKTAADKLQMKGEPVNVSNIERNVREEISSVKQRVAEGGKQAGTVVSRLFEAIGELVRFLFRFIGKLIVGFVVIIGLIVAVAFLMGLFGIFGAPWVSYPPFMGDIFSTKGTFIWAYVGTFLAIGLPFIMLVYAGIRYLLNIKTTNKMINMSALGLWITGVIICLFVGMGTARQFSNKESVKQQIALQQPTHGILYLSVKNNEPDESKYDNDIDFDDEFTFSINDRKVKLSDVKLDIVKSNTDQFELTRIMYARGRSRQEAAINAQHVNYAFTQNDSSLVFDRTFQLIPGEKFRAQRMQLVLKVPVGKKVYLSENMKRIIFDIDNIGEIWDHDMVNRTWEMTEQGLKCVDCTGEEENTSGDKVLITDHGDTVNISNGIHIKKNGREVIRIDKNGVVIHDDESK